ncbi:MerR family transcriptional regulator [Paenibacillus sp. 598K]|uniref:MerR family transcriptional regulator n=1 Tax=Paenibacillus sp. 598K TaxID=1117987 RepID=UPI000FFAA936|nr:MerR family transcriptional regulator [Paenibacillus sp. 598K]GBF75908.1 MerR family transcriptional regulator [Paenibacillus sp. 598K]
MPTTYYSPKQMAERLQVSTTTLRRYEELDLLPPIARALGNRKRVYTDLHLQAFVTIRAMLRAFSIPVAYDVMRGVRRGQTDDMLWLLNEQQYEVQVEKRRLSSVLAMIRDTNSHELESKIRKPSLTIGEAARIAGVRTSAIRHWEKERLIRSTRHPDNGYRLYTPQELRKIIVISSLRQTVYAIDEMRQLLASLETHSLQAVERSFQLAVDKLQAKLRLQFDAIAELSVYLGFLE